MKKSMILLLAIVLTFTGTACSSSNEDDFVVEAYAECLKRVMDEAEAAGTDKFDMSVCDNL